MKNKKIKNRVLISLFLLITTAVNARQITSIFVTSASTFFSADTVLIQLSERLLYYVKTEIPTDEIETAIFSIDKKRLRTGLNNDDAKKTFWVNMYNAWYQVLAGRQKMKGPAIFTERKIPVAGVLFSLDEIEHGILRRDWQRLKKVNTKETNRKNLIQQLAVSKKDYRIHFALNCGARSCPPIAFYAYLRINQQLDVATRSFMKNNSKIDDDRKEVTVSQLIEWYIKDFGGEKGFREIIKKVIKKDVSGYRILFSEYNWEEDLRNFTEGY